MRTIIRNVTLVNEGRVFLGHLGVEDERIFEILSVEESIVNPSSLNNSVVISVLASTIVGLTNIPSLTPSFKV